MTGKGEQPNAEGAETLSLVPDFIENVEEYLATHKIENVDILIERLQQKLQNYTMAENRALTRRQKQMERQVHLNKSIACVKMLMQKQESQEDAIVDYSLGANVFAQARLPAVKNVCLWLGADVMAEYPLEEAHEFLCSTLSDCEKSLESNQEEWGKVKDCKTTIEVNIARCYNYSVEKNRRLKKVKDVGDN